MSAVPRPIVWSIAGNDSGGGAGLSADARAAEAFGAHLCPVVAAVTAQNSRAVTRVAPVAPDLLDAQLATLADDMPPAPVKTGLLGSAENVAVVARWVDRLRARSPRLALVIDPVLGASTGAAFGDESVLRAYRDLLLPRATVVTPNEREARRLVADEGAAVPGLAQALRAGGAAALAITGGDSAHAPGLSLDWIDTPQARGWLALPRIATQHPHRRVRAGVGLRRGRCTGAGQDGEHARHRARPRGRAGAGAGGGTRRLRHAARTDAVAVLRRKR